MPRCQQTLNDKSLAFRMPRCRQTLNDVVLNYERRICRHHHRTTKVSRRSATGATTIEVSATGLTWTMVGASALSSRRHSKLKRYATTISVFFIIKHDFNYFKMCNFHLLQFEYSLSHAMQDAMSWRGWILKTMKFLKQRKFT